MIAAVLLIAAASTGCAAYTPPLTPQLRRQEAIRLAATARFVRREKNSALSGLANVHQIRPSEISRVVADRNWRFVIAALAGHESAMFAYHRTTSGYRALDVWGGDLEPGEHGIIAAWARKLPQGGAPRQLADCVEAAWTKPS